MPPQSDLARLRLRFALSLVCVAATVVAAFVRFPGVPRTPHGVRLMAAEWGAFAPALYVLVIAARPFLLLPSGLLFIGGGLAFGPVLGTIYSVIGGALGGVLVFGIARWLGRDFVWARLGSHLKWMNDPRWGAGAVLVLNAIPIVPVTAINYAAGLSRVGFGAFMLAVVAGLTPRAIAFSIFGQTLLNVGSPGFYLALGALVLLVAMPLLLRRLWTADAKTET